MTAAIRTDRSHIGALAYEALIGATGLSVLGDVLLGLSRNQSAVGELFSYWIADDGRPVPIVSAGAIGSASARAALYTREFHYLDPLRPMLATVVEDGPMMNRYVRARDIVDRRYRRECFEHPQLGGKLSFLNRRANRTLVLSFYGSSVGHQLAEVGLAQLAQIALPVLRKHADLADSVDGVTPASRISYRLMRIFPSLTRREREVCARTILGMTAESIAIDLGIGAASVATYRKRACARFAFSSPAQFAAALIN